VHPFGDRQRGAALRLAITQGRFLVEVAALQRGNLDSGFQVRSVRFPADFPVELTVRLPSGKSKMVRVSTDTNAAQLGELVDEGGVLHPPNDGERQDLIIRGPGPTMLAELLRDLGSNVDALVHYRTDIGPLALSLIEIEDDPEAVRFSVMDDDGRQYGFRYVWKDIARPLVGELYCAVDTIADGRGDPDGWFDLS
jgi:hypothetical protein